MDILRPPIIKIGNRRYRRNPISAEYAKIYADNESNVTRLVDEEVDEADSDTDLEQLPNGNFCAYLSVPHQCMGLVLGRGRSNKLRIESETKTQISVPGPGLDGFTRITGAERRGVAAAKSRFELLASNARRKQKFTHFLSIPVNTPEICQNFATFQTLVLEHCSGDRGIDDTLFQISCKLHITLGIMVLLNEAEISKAASVLGECSDTIIKSSLSEGPLRIRIKGLEYMNDDPSAVDVLYAKVSDIDGDDFRIQSFCDELVEKFVSSGLMDPSELRDSVKLHITVMNSKYRVLLERNSGDQSKMYNRENFDASTILKNYGEFDFGELTINSVHLSYLQVDEATGYFKFASIVDF